MAGDQGTPSKRRQTLTRRVLSAADQEEVPIRTILTTVLVVVLTGLILVVAWLVRDELLLLVVGVFVAIVLAGPVDFLQRRGLGRGLATTTVFVVALVGFLGIAYLFGNPLVSHLVTFFGEFTKLEKKAAEGKGWVGGIARRFGIEHWIAHNIPKTAALKKDLSKLVSPILHFGAAAVTTILAFVTVAFIAFFLLLDLPKVWRGALSMLPEDRARRVDRVVREAVRGVSGYVAGNVATSVIAGIVVGVALLACGVPFWLLLASWVAMVDLLPIVGTLVAAVPVLLVAVLHSIAAFIVLAIVIVVYQQIENHVLNPIIMSRTVRLSKLGILLAVLFTAALGDTVYGIAGAFIGALLGIPLGSAIQVVVRELRHPSPVADRAEADS